ncbi:phospholipid transporting ATPase [Coniosporium tulheliwenetii]|uniref:Phospholipid transporting ATPase n=1 Tax=Coniosporium tulheliwenetii TaxID=3383036 RepID=A0ACC2YJD1_9PEZI|nr:phospholipid transporting ATPase [Cladosporium sp. JES 115]
MALQPYQENSEVSNPTKRIRWATHRASGQKGDRKRQSLIERMHKRTGSAESKSEANGDAMVTSGGETPASYNSSEVEDSGRRIFFNIPLPADARDEQGHPIAHFARNKIRTAKYTPISFIPKNLWFQFHNIANVYFLFIIILGIFPIFGADNPALNAVPLIVILFVTAVKDGIEDWRRTVLDNELNNAPVHRLVDFNNVNTAEDKISLWRKLKKATTRAITFAWRKWQGRKSSKKRNMKTYAETAMDQPRPSIDTRRTSVVSRSSRRTSYHSTRSQPGDDGIQMSPVPSPLPGQSPQKEEYLDIPGEPATTVSYEQVHAEPYEQASASEKPRKARPEPPRRFHGSLINPLKQAPDKARFKKDYWKNVQVGDFVRLYNEEQVPADIVVLSTSDHDGACYIETKNLDGETNLKVRQALHCGRSVKHARHCEQSEFVIESEGPHANLYSYSGVIRWKQHDLKNPDGATVDMAEPISINNVLLRGSSVRNTEWVLGVVIFTGEETKIMLNSGITPSKRAKISKDLNWNVIYNFIILFFMCLIAGIVQGVTWSQTDSTITYFEFGSYGGSPPLDGFITFWAAVILFQNLVPISLYITLEIIRTAQAYFIYSDVLMYYDKIDYPCTPKSWNISDDLGQIEYIFSDKTGTLTQNVMEFKKATINGVPYGEAYTEAQAGMHRRQGINVEEEGARAREQIAQDRARMLNRLRKIHPNPYLLDDQLTFVAPDFVDDLAGESGEEQKLANEQFMLALALCHTVITEKTPGDPPRIEFKAQSPDEAALVATARDCGFTVLGRADDKIILNVQGEERRYTVLNTLEFNSSRKRMSAIIRMPNGKILLFCKGADSVIYSRLRRGEQPELRKATAEHLEMFAREGLRTLCIAQRELGEEEYQEWNKEHDLAAAAVQDREEKLERVSDAIERELLLLGGTAIEDRLQDGVPDAIALLGDAGIKLWVLTGDKVETAINIGFSCNLLNNDMDLIVFTASDDKLETAEALLDRHLKTFNMTGSDEELKAAQDDHEPPEPTHAIIIDGDSLKLVLDDTLKQKFLLLCKQCKAVLCCRVSPSQKAAVVQMVKRGLDCLTLSIGDGANDVAMIQEAHVGVGIAGEEGRQAVMSSDYAIGQFRFLTRLVLVHGRWSYRRLAETIANFFYKNLVWTFSLFWYQIYCNFDCAYIFDYTYIILYNLAFTSLPVILMGVLDQDVSDKVSLAVPQLYRRGIERKEWTQPKFWLYMLDGVYQSLICFYMVYLVFAPANFVTESGMNIDDNARMGVYIGSAAVTVVNVYLLLNTYRWDWLILLITVISILLIWFWTGVYTATTAGFRFYQAAPQVYGQLSFWATVLLTVIICLLPRFAVKSFQKMYKPLDVDIIREQVRQGKFDYLKDVDVKYVAPSPEYLSSGSSEASKKDKPNGNGPVRDDERPIYPPSVAPTGTTHNPRSHNGSDGTDYTGHVSWNERKPSVIVEPPPRPSLEHPRNSLDRPRPSFDRVRLSMDKCRPSFEASSDFTSAALLSRVESSHSAARASKRRNDITSDLG